jgi:hypothetical protein
MWPITRKRPAPGGARSRQQCGGAEMTGSQWKTTPAKSRRFIKRCAELGRQLRKMGVSFGPQLPPGTSVDDGLRTMLDRLRASIEGRADSFPSNLSTVIEIDKKRRRVNVLFSRKKGPPIPSDVAARL